MAIRSLILALAFAATAAPALAESTLHMHAAIIKSFHPDSEADYSTLHPSLGIGGSLAGEWLQWRAGMTYNSHSRWGPFGGLVATLEVAEGWRVGVESKRILTRCVMEWIGPFVSRYCVRIQWLGAQRKAQFVTIP